ncbi:MAG: aminotransferase class V-fold PLP-dependent enzyme [Candidatus Latescibacterota bacterium]|nr:aminotransferase class V-fold PLP-dependent enzyme [Candidatus Latescibacterota bacterium]
MTTHTDDLAVLPYLKERPDNQSIYQAIGLETIINCRGTFTIIGGSVELPEVLYAMEAASGYFVQYDELANAVGERLAAITGAEWGLIASGCAAAIKHVTIACVTGGNPEKLIRVPGLEGLDKTEVIIPRHSRNVYDHAVRNVGIDVVMVDSVQELEEAINPRTAMLYVTTGRNIDEDQPLSLSKIAAIAEPRGIPILADAAAENLTIPNVHLERGATFVAYSGGKALCGPQCAGIVLGQKNILMSAWQASSPHHGPGRDDKIGKEEVMGMLAAVEAWVTRDHDADWQSWLEILDLISQKVTKVPGVQTRVEEPEGLNNRAPSLVASWNSCRLHITGEEVAEDFARKSPRIAVGSSDDGDTASIRITPSQMQPGDDEVVAERICAILTEDRPPRKIDHQPAGADLSGRWNLAVDYHSSRTTHHLLLTQDGNWIEGLHESDFAMQPISGIVEDNAVRLRSIFHRPGDTIPFLFSGTVSGETFSGSIHLGEYLMATFSAHRVPRTVERRDVSIPGGPPLAT